MRIISRILSATAGLVLLCGVVSCSSGDANNSNAGADKKAESVAAPSTAETNADNSSDSPKIIEVEIPADIVGQPTFSAYNSGMGNLLLKIEKNPNLSEEEQKSILTEAEQKSYDSFITCVAAESYGTVSVELANKLAASDFEHILNAPIPDADNKALEAAIAKCEEKIPN